MKLLLPLFLFIYLSGTAQRIEHRIILFGDAGEINDGQKLAIQKANELIIHDKTSVYFLGDNIYPLGMGLDSVSSIETTDILKSQFESFLLQNVPVTFLAGNHDWDKSGKEGLAKVKAQENYIANRKNDNLRYLPQAGTANIYISEVSKTAIAVLYDSEYWLFPHHANQDSALSPIVRNEFLKSIQHVVDNNKDKTIFILSHHPMRSFGEHGKNLTWKDHIFPLTRKWKNMYLPLPVLGSIFPLLRTTVFNSAEDARHPQYKQLIEDIISATKSHQNIVFIAGHDHGLQYIEDKLITQIVTGSGSKRSFIANHPTLKYVSNQQGFSVLDILDDNTFRISFYAVHSDEVNISFETLLPQN
jgi:tartrate-resistant acid phosphatase type 5